MEMSHSVKEKMLLLCALLIGAATAAEDYALCDHQWKSTTFLNPFGKSLSPVNIRGPGRQTDLIAMDSFVRGSKLGIATATKEGIFSNAKTDTLSITIPQSLFDFYVADVNGDERDDLVFRYKPDGFFKVSYFNGLPKFSEEQDIAPGYICDTSAVIGDFDGNGADDFLCYDNTASSLDGLTMLLNPACGSFDNNRNRRPYVHGGAARSNRHRCSPVDPVTLVFPAGTAPDCNFAAVTTLSVGDANGDGKDDIICFKSDSSVSVYMSHVSISSATFSSTAIIIAADTSTCNFGSDRIIPLDIDGDGDDDLACTAKRQTGKVPTISYALPSGYSTFENPQCSTKLICASSIQYLPGDFNGDGKEDLMCRSIVHSSDIGLHSKTCLVFSEKHKVGN